MHLSDLLHQPRVAVALVALLASAVTWHAARRSCDGGAPARYLLAASMLALAGLAIVGVLAPVIAYSLTCLGLATGYLVALVREERARARRYAALTPRPPIEPVPAIWIGVALLSTVALIPYASAGSTAFAAAIVGLCALAMATIAWRIATAPTQITGDNPQLERRHERTLRTVKIGLTSIVTVGSIAVFLSFTGAPAAPFGGLGHVSGGDVFWVWDGLLVWVFGYWIARSVTVRRRAAP